VRKVRFHTQVPAATVARVRAAVVGMTRVKGAYTLSQLVDDALNDHVAELEARHNGGRPWPALEDDTQLQRGRRINGSGVAEGADD